MSSLEIDITIARWMGFEVTPTGRIIACHRPDASWLLKPELLPRFTSDPRAIVQLEQELGTRGLGERYAIALARRVRYDKTPAGAFKLIAATCQERCDAALAVIGEAG